MRSSLRLAFRFSKAVVRSLRQFSSGKPRIGSGRQTLADPLSECFDFLPKGLLLRPDPVQTMTQLARTGQLPKAPWTFSQLE